MSLLNFLETPALLLLLPLHGRKAVSFSVCALWGEGDGERWTERERKRATAKSRRERSRVLRVSGFPARLLYRRVIFKHTPLAYYSVSSPGRSGSPLGSISCSHAGRFKGIQGMIALRQPGSERRKERRKKGGWIFSQKAGLAHVQSLTERVSAALPGLKLHFSQSISV